VFLERVVLSSDKFEPQRRKDAKFFDRINRIDRIFLQEFFHLVNPVNPVSYSLRLCGSFFLSFFQTVNRPLHSGFDAFLVLSYGRPIIFSYG
jgi:hypothetical protein